MSAAHIVPPAAGRVSARANQRNELPELTLSRGDGFSFARTLERTEDTAPSAAAKPEREAKAPQSLPVTKDAGKPAEAPPLLMSTLFAPHAPAGRADAETAPARAAPSFPEGHAEERQTPEDVDAIRIGEMAQPSLPPPAAHGSEIAEQTDEAPAERRHGTGTSQDTPVTHPQAEVPRAVPVPHAAGAVPQVEAHDAADIPARLLKREAMPPDMRGRGRRGVDATETLAYALANTPAMAGTPVAASAARMTAAVDAEAISDARLLPDATARAETKAGADRKRSRGKPLPPDDGVGRDAMIVSERRIAPGNADDRQAKSPRAMPPGEPASSGLGPLNLSALAAPPSPPESAAQQIVRQLSMAGPAFTAPPPGPDVHGVPRSMRLRLSPEHLGEVEIRLIRQDGQLAIRISTESSAAAESLRQDAATLQGLLEMVSGANARVDIEIGNFTDSATRHEVSGGMTGSFQGGSGRNAPGRTAEPREASAPHKPLAAIQSDDALDQIRKIRRGGGRPDVLLL